MRLRNPAILFLITMEGDQGGDGPGASRHARSTAGRHRRQRGRRAHRL